MGDSVDRIFRDHNHAIMGIVNVTPDSFSDGGLFADPGAAVQQGLALAGAGADLLDIGGESTRPGSQGVSAELELERVLPVIRELKRLRPELPLSIDTSKAAVAEAALDAGASIVNDVTAGSEEGMLALVARRGVPFVMMHMRGRPRTMQRDTHYDDVVAEVAAYLAERGRVAQAEGVDPRAIIVDPGIGFGKDIEGNLALLRGLPTLAGLGYPLLIGTSRKSFLGLITGAPVEGRAAATLASLVPALALGRSILRVHDVSSVAHFRAVLEALGIRGASFRYS